MKKVLFFIHDLKSGGAEKVLVNLVNHMDRSRFDITVMTLFDTGVNKQFLNRAIKYKSVFKREFRGNRILLQLFKPEFLFRTMVKDRYDILISYLEGSSTRIIGGCTDNSVRKIAWRHISETEKEFIQCYRSLKEAKQIYSRYDLVACVSEAVKNNFMARIGEFILPVKVLYNTVETEVITRKALEKVDNPAFEYNGLKLIGVGKVRPRKGFMRLAEVHKQLQSEGYRYKLFVLGEGEEQSKIEKYLQENNLQDTFCFLGYDTNPYKYVAKSDLFICSSYEEGFSTAATEALIVGTPVFTTDCSGMREMLGYNNEFGMVVENSEDGIYKGLKKILDDPAVLRYYSQKANERRGIFNTENTVAAVQDQIESITFGDLKDEK